MQSNDDDDEENKYESTEAGATDMHQYFSNGEDQRQKPQQWQHEEEEQETQALSMDDLTATVTSAHTAGQILTHEEKESPRFGEASPDVSPQKYREEASVVADDHSTLVDNSTLVIQTNVEEKQ